MKTRITTLAVVLFVMGIFVSTSTAAMTCSKGDYAIANHSQSQAQEMKCGEKGCGEQKKEGCKDADKCERKKNCEKDCEKSCCKKDKEGCSKEESRKGCQKGENTNKGCQKGSTCGK